MKVKELIEKLQQFDQDAVVLHRGYEDGYDIAGDSPDEIYVVPRIDAEWYNGSYDIAVDSPDEYDKERFDYDKRFKAVII